MKRKSLPRLALIVTLTCVLASCATMRKAGETSVAAVKTTTSAAMARVSDLPVARLLPGQSPQVVKVREKDLKELPTGQELAKAHQQRSGLFWIAGGPINIPEPVLPEPGSELDGSLLPPRMP